MQTEEKLKMLKVISIILLVLFLPVLLLYLGVIVPEYLACANCIYEGCVGTDIWGSEVQCFGDSKAFGKMFFQLSSIVVAGLSIVSFILFFFIYRLKKKLL